MSNIFKISGKSFTVNRFPKSTNKSLRSWSSADELMISYIYENKLDKESLALYNDRFGFLSTVLNQFEPMIIVDYKSQERAIIANLMENKMEFAYDKFLTPLAPIEKKIDLGLVKIPKSTNLFQLHLQSLSNYLTDDGVVLCSFMTKHFTKQMIEIAELYFDSVEQSQAHKKARLLILKSPKKDVKVELLNELKIENKSLIQYFGVFSSKHIDYASQFLIENLDVPENSEMGLDLASGNGVLAYSIRQKNKEVEMHLVDDMQLAVESSKLNVTDDNTYFHYNNSLEEFESGFFDFAVSNPPFHFEHETNIEISLKLFKEVKRCLKTGGTFQLVANQHLNYRTHLIKIFASVDIVNENDKFVVYCCKK